MSMGYTESFTQAVQQLDKINPQSTSAEVDGSWVDVKNFARFVAKMQTGAIAGTATLTFQLRQATSAAGANAKAFKTTGALADTVDGNTYWLEARNEELDVDGGFHFVRLEVVAGVAASLVSAELLGYVHRFGPVTQPVTLISA